MLHERPHVAYVAQAKWDCPLITKYLRCPRYLGVSNADAASSGSDDTPLTRKAPFQEERNDHRFLVIEHDGLPNENERGIYRNH